MSGQKSTNALISREYNPSPTACTRALKLLLKNSEVMEVMKGGPHDLTNASTTETVKNGPRKTEQENT